MAGLRLGRQGSGCPFPRDLKNGWTGGLPAHSWDNSKVWAQVKAPSQDGTCSGTSNCGKTWRAKGSDSSQELVRASEAGEDSGRETPSQGEGERWRHQCSGCCLLLPAHLLEMPPTGQIRLKA